MSKVHKYSESTSYTSCSSQDVKVSSNIKLVTCTECLALEPDESKSPKKFIVKGPVTFKVEAPDELALWEILYSIPHHVDTDVELGDIDFTSFTVREEPE